MDIPAALSNWGIFSLSSLRVIPFDHFGGHSNWPYCGIFQLPFLSNTQISLIGGYLTCPFWGVLMEYYSTCPFWGIFHWPFFEGCSTCPLWGMFHLPFLMDLPFLRDILLALFEEIQLALFEGCSTRPFWGIFHLPFLRDIPLALVPLALFEGYSTCPFWGTFHLPFLRDIPFALPFLGIFYLYIACIMTPCLSPLNASLPYIFGSFYKCRINFYDPYCLISLFITI